MPVYHNITLSPYLTINSILTANLWAA